MNDASNTESTFDGASCDVAAERNRLLPVELCFVRHFTHGVLVGMSLVDSMRFESEARAQAWIDGVNANNGKGIVDHFVTRA